MLFFLPNLSSCKLKSNYAICFRIQKSHASPSQLNLCFILIQRRSVESAQIIFRKLDKFSCIVLVSAVGKKKEMCLKQQQRKNFPFLSPIRDKTFYPVYSVFLFSFIFLRFLPWLWIRDLQVEE